MSTLKVGTIQDHANSNTAISIDSAGRVTQPAKPAFTVSCTSGAVLAGGDIVFNLAHINNGNHYNTSNGRFTAPVSGLYFFCWSMLHETIDGRSGSFYFKVNGSQAPTTTNGFFDQSNDDYRANTSWNQILNLTANQYVQCYSSVQTYRTNHAWSGFLI